MILTYKILHNRDFSIELKLAKLVAERAVKNRNFSSSSVKDIGLKSIISNQILRKYGNNRKIKKVKSVPLIVPGIGIKINKQEKTIYVPCLKLLLKYNFSEFSKINQIELDSKYAYIAVTIPEKENINPVGWLGIDLNTTGHCVVGSCSKTGKVLKLGKNTKHIREKYKNQRRKLQKKKKFSLLKKIKNKEARCIKDINHKVSRKIVNEAANKNYGIVLEDLKGIRKTKKQAKGFKYFLHSWPFYQLGTFISYKAKLLGIPVVKIDPAYTSQQCSRCGLLGTRIKKLFKCPNCGHVEDADVNASFVIGLRHQGILRSIADRDVMEGITDTPKKAPARRMLTLEPHVL